MNTTMKQGRPTKTEEEFVREHVQELGVQETAKKLNRDPESVSKMARRLGVAVHHSKSDIINAEFDIKNSIHWKELKQQFAEDELELFLHHWSEIIAQFKDDVLHTEKLQIIDIVKLEVLMNRVLKQERSQIKQIEDIRNMVELEKSKPIEERDEVVINNLERQLLALHSAQEDLSKQHRDLLKEKKLLFREIKGTREQRIKRLEDSKESGVGWIRKLLLRPDLRRRLGIEMEKMRLAADAEYERLSEWHKYEDGEIDQPILTPENVKEE